ncbi:hypothetical protein [uncultured phage MedDCM-OCT-S08-C1441]|nr:hypothetical protein [uncultured phage MedDCM-OCT-S08-C1441]
MATTFTWAVNTLDRELSDGYVSTVHYTVNAADDTYSAGAYGSVGLERPETLIAYADLTESQVIEWVKPLLAVTKVTEIQLRSKHNWMNSALQPRDKVSPGANATS